MCPSIAAASFRLSSYIWPGSSSGGHGGRNKRASLSLPQGTQSGMNVHIECPISKEDGSGNVALTLALGNSLLDIGYSCHAFPGRATTHSLAVRTRPPQAPAVGSPLFLQVVLVKIVEETGFW